MTLDFVFLYPHAHLHPNRPTLCFFKAAQAIGGGSGGGGGSTIQERVRLLWSERDSSGLPQISSIPADTTPGLSITR